ncbi:hypothetical protein [Neptunomonas sp. XY-337]|uniref:hypothetical protein n=1 Tax=Neptunomonas sp. XY-337 TaxID=2561897 RepID=UPI0010AAA3E4|nr:hypothetical protein [Neptunomonas sp. XY-337]
MSEDPIQTLLRHCTLQQLEAIHTALEKRAAERAAETAARRERQKLAAPPRSSTDVEKMADDLGLDLSGLMREISKR